MSINLNEIKPQIEHILSLLDKYHFEQVFEDCDHYHWYDSLPSEVTDDIDVEDGATRFCIIPRHYDFVIKCDKYSEDSYCSDEFTVYNLAKEKGVEDYFAGIACYGYHKFGDIDTELYVMEKCDIDYDKIDSSSLTATTRKLAHDAHSDDYKSYIYEASRKCSESRVHFLCLEQWGEAITQKVEEFIDYIGINDLHCGNWGYRHGRLVMTDYCGFETNLCFD